MSKPGPLKSDEIYLGNYLLTRLAQLGVKPIYGVPGDFNLTFLDLVEDHPSVEWIGCCNELNAAYAADGYARVKQSQSNAEGHEGVRGLGALITTFGVGELSALNGIAGAYSERVPVVHIVGVPSTVLQKEGKLLHHTLGDGQFKLFADLNVSLTAFQTFLKDEEDPRVLIKGVDKVLRGALETARPTYLALPTNLVFAPVPSSSLWTPLIPHANDTDAPQVKEVGGTEKNEKGKQEELLKFVTKEVERLWNDAKNPALFIDACALRYGVTGLVEELVKKTGVQYFTTPMGKGGLPEDPSLGFAGVYTGAISPPSVQARFEKADLVILVGGLLSDFNSGEFSTGDKMQMEKRIELHSDHTVVQFAHYPGVDFKTLLPHLINTLKRKSKVEQSKGSEEKVAKAVLDQQDEGSSRAEIEDGPPNEMIKQAAFWPMWGEKFFQENDIVVAETGTSSFGMIDVPLPRGATFVSQTLWGSIGWAGGATLGCLMAAKESKVPRRVILFIGDGSLQLTVQEISTMLRQGLKPIIVVLNNDGYVIERLINGPERKYNDISHWKWQELLSFFNADNIPNRTYLASTRAEFKKILADKAFRSADCCQLLEVKMGRLDGPRILVEQAKLSAELNSG